MKMQLSNISTLQPSNTEYILVIKGKPEGPFSIEQLKGLGIKPEDFVKTAEMPDYKEAHEMAELREIFHFDKRTVVPQYFGSFDQRLTASVLDWFFISGIFILLAFAGVILVADKAERLYIALSILAFTPPTKIIYHMVMECSARQATYGKQILKIRVCDMEGKRISPAKSISRNFCKIFSLITLGVGYLLCFFNKKQQCLHDMMAGTLVMKDRLL